MSTALYAELKRIAADQLNPKSAAIEQTKPFAFAGSVCHTHAPNPGHARGRNAQKRGGGALKVTLHENSAVAQDPAVEVLAIDQAITVDGDIYRPIVVQISKCHSPGGNS